MNCHTFHALRHVCPIFGPSRNQRRPFLLLFALYPARFVHPVYVHFVLFVLPYTLHAISSFTASFTDLRRTRGNRS